MSRSVTVNAGGRKGEAPRRLAAAIAGAVEGARSGGLPEVVLDVIAATGQAANKLICRAPKGAVVQVQACIQEDPISGWSASVLVDVTAG
ncbi:MAG TPA: hypothetical protein VF615_25705 [Longimicrobiaceae bacterium]|jgi:hypothetical protein